MSRPENAGFRTHLKSRALKITASVGLAVTAVAFMAQYGEPRIDSWWEAGDGRVLPMFVRFPDPTGELMVLNSDGDLRTQGHAFFDAKGPNGRACVTCHQPSNSMSIAASQVRERWKETGGKDPVFAAIDGSNCPSLPQAERSSHSLLLDRGLFRIYLPWPAVSSTGTPIQPEFTIEVVHDPTGCNTSAVYGLNSPTPTISVYRRPRVVGNLKYVLGSENAFNADSRSLVPVMASLAADGRDRTLEQQAADAMHAHEQSGTTLTKAELQQILDFESQIYVAQTSDTVGRDLAEVDGPLGAWSLGRNKVADDASHTTIFFDSNYWKTAPSTADRTPQSDYRQSVARGNAIFTSRTFHIDGAANLTEGHTATPATGTCATCHTAHMAGSNSAQRAMDVGTTMLPYTADSKDLPLFKITCNKDAAPHPYLGRVLYTTDPGRALITGKCSDVGSIVMQQFRGLSARAPYFSNGSAQTLRDVVDFYDTRFDIHLNEAEKKDLVNFLGAL